MRRNFFKAGAKCKEIKFDGLPKKPYIYYSTFPFYIMSENPNSSGAVTRKVVNMNIPEDVTYWTSKWRITREQLQHAVELVGGKEARVADYLRSKGTIRF